MSAVLVIFLLVLILTASTSLFHLFATTRHLNKSSTLPYSIISRKTTSGNEQPRASSPLTSILPLHSLSSLSHPLCRENTITTNKWHISTSPLSLLSYKHVLIPIKSSNEKSNDKSHPQPFINFSTSSVPNNGTVCDNDNVLSYIKAEEAPVLSVSALQGTFFTWYGDCRPLSFTQQKVFRRGIKSSLINVMASDVQFGHEECIRSMNRVGLGLRSL
mmetsp:Transcript_2039/g.2566  ORF Transcript_2039/g.2566 Transcript_2039/m.2566 type:complete len:217 (-) Transcript_2039:230-880(-)